jgi:FkbM family methyltransferase
MRRLSEILACARATGRWIQLLLDYVRLTPLRYPYSFVLRTGEKLTLHEHTDTIVFWLIFARRHYPVDPSCRVILDIGANIGMFTLYAAREARAARIIAVEPFPDTCRRLKDLTAVNRLEDRVTVVNCAVTGKAGNRTMDSADGIPSQYRRIHAPETATLNPTHRGPAAAQPDDNGVPVRSQTLSQVLDQCGVAAADLVKINIHGSEYDVLLSTDPKDLLRCRKIALQYHDMPAAIGLGKQHIFDRLQGLGFVLLLDDDTRRGSGRAVLAIPS